MYDYATITKQNETIQEIKNTQNEIKEIKQTLAEQTRY